MAEQYIETPAVLDENGAEVTPAVLEWRIKPGLEFLWWAGSGKFMVQAGTYDQDGNEVTPPQFAPGVVLLLRLHHAFFDDDRLDPADPETAEDWDRSKVARYIKTNGTPGTTAGITYYEMDGVRLYRPADVAAFIAARGLPGHRFL